ncbi:Transcriptional regulator, Crp/Fnr family [Hyella patelloides LEGE 07179]|uniref:Transcriptional regulator, Crp/Fnr family n=1 Tax=Hyella patelloides LEGE 07179 TaxID=945734 RepID=A0A563VTQ5_9CYAN|nr:Crp/Fnr family transcriptional regulator [Hyella patelloides]VEP14862.1 Transcriptional regulator, Crp/Fnr family [Hyella patelloides LEGE 07179]
MNNPRNNHILSALPQKEYQRFSDYLEPVQLSLNEILLESNRKIELLYFPTQGVVSLISAMGDGSTTEIGLIGKEGMVGTLQFLGDGILNSQSVVQGEGTAMKIDTEALQVEYDRGQMLQKLLLRYALKLFNQVSQCAACNNHHTVKQRTARWLLMLDDRSDHETLLMTQQLLSRMLGVRRTGVTEVAKEIQRRGIIDYHRGKIKILDRDALEAVACECYQVLKDWSTT